MLCVAIRDNGIVDAWAHRRSRVYEWFQLTALSADFSE